MKRKILCCITILSLAFLLSGCQDNLKTEAELLEDLASDPYVCIIEGSQVTGLSVIKRLTDEADKTDKVYVSVSIDHPAASATRAYIMNYTHYNEGWMLDSIEDYYGSDAEWNTQPKQAPTSEYILQLLISASNYALDIQYSQWDEEHHLSEKYPRVYFFEEGKYAVTTYTGEFNSHLQYDCIVEIERLFEYVTTEETRLLHFQFNPYVYEWELSGEETIDERGRWYLEGQWKTGYAGETVTFTRTGRYSESRFNGLWQHEDKEKSFSLELSFPKPDHIPLGSAHTISSLTGGVELAFEIMPTKILCWDSKWNSNRLGGFELFPDMLAEIPEPLEATGLIDMSTGPEADEYRVAAKELLTRLFTDRDTAYLESVWHPSSELEWVIEQIQNGYNWNYVTNMLHTHTMVIDADDPAYADAFANFQERGLNADQIANCTYYMYTSDDGANWASINVVFAKIDNTIYVFDMY